MKKEIINSVELNQINGGKYDSESELTVGQRVKVSSNQRLHHRVKDDGSYEDLRTYHGLKDISAIVLQPVNSHGLVLVQLCEDYYDASYDKNMTLKSGTKIYVERDILK